jgi:hypothetical protein
VAADIIRTLIISCNRMEGDKKMLKGGVKNPFHPSACGAPISHPECAAQDELRRHGSHLG